MKENRTLEFKREATNTFLKTVSAFANFGDGTIMFGVDDSGTSVGLNEPEKISLDIENRINDSISPKPDYTININRRTNVISLKISEGKYKPYLYKGKAYRRSDTATVEVDQSELRRLTLEGANLYYEELPCGEASLKFSYFESKLIEKLGITRLNDDILRTFGFYNGDKKLNIAAALVADENRYSGVDIARFGKNISEILDRETFEKMSVLEQYDRAVSMYRRYCQYDKIEGIDRITVETVPETAFREALVNAIVHRTWDIDSHIRISILPDRVEIVSPGGLPKGLTKDEYMNGYVSNLRNPIIGNVFFRLHYIEMFGTGIRRIMDAYKDLEVNPSFDITDNAVRVCLPFISKYTGHTDVTHDGQKVIDLLSGPAQLSGREIAEKLEWNKYKALREINKLISLGYIEKHGSGRSTKYTKR